MGRYRNGRYYSSKDDSELQWLEDGVGLVGNLLLHGVTGIVTGVFQLICGIFQLFTPPKA